MLYIVIIVTISICCRIIEHIRTWHIINKSDVIIVEDVSVLDLIWAMKDFLKDTVILLPKMVVWWIKIQKMYLVKLDMNHIGGL